MLYSEEVNNNCSDIRSPFTQGRVAELEKISTSDLISKYIHQFNIDVSSYFHGIKTISLYKCNDTTYSFYYPFNIEGDKAFYEHFQQFKWYYMPWKWEHEKAKNLITENMKILEVGCAEGDFLMKIKECYNAECIGLEFNEKAIEVANQKGLKVFSETIEQHSIKNFNTYDLVCSFQVLEHVSEIKTFLEAQILCLKSGGKLLISVPNNNSFIGLDFFNNILNMPPHHMGLWNRKSLSLLSKYFPLKSPLFYYEPVQPYHREWYINSLKKNIKDFEKLKFVKLFYNILPVFFQRAFNYFSLLFLKMIYRKGHTILVVFEKR